MNKLATFKTSLLLATMLALPVAQAASTSKADYKAGKTRISTEYKADKAACDSLAGNAKDICAEQAKAKRKVARADWEYQYTGKARDQNKVLVAKAESNYAVASQKCDDLGSNRKDVCVKEAKAIEVKALADAKAGKEIAAARKDASQDARDADYKVATTKCDALSGDAKAACVTAAKAQFGKS